MSQSLDVPIVGRVLSNAPKAGISSKTGKPYSMPQVELLTGKLDKVVVGWADNAPLPANGAGVQIEARASGSAFGLELRMLTWEPIVLTGILAMIAEADKASAANGKP